MNLNTSENDIALEVLKKRLTSIDERNAVAKAQTLEEAEKLLIVPCGGAGIAAERVRRAREWAEIIHGGGEAATIVGQGFE